jgi:hypothetical protein
MVTLPVVSFWNFHTWSLPIPNQQALLGRTLFAQALVFHGSGLAAARLTNRFGDIVFR